MGNDEEPADTATHTSNVSPSTRYENAVEDLNARLAVAEEQRAIFEAEIRREVKQLRETVTETREEVKRLQQLNVVSNQQLKETCHGIELQNAACQATVQTLERFVGKPLFARRHQAMVPNEDGQTLMEQIAPLLDQLSDAVEAMTSGQEVLRLRLGVRLRLRRGERYGLGEWPRLGK